MTTARVDELKYSVSKQLTDNPERMIINTTYGDIPISDDDAEAIQALLKKRFECKIRAYEINT